MKVEIIDGKLHFYPNSPTETWAMEQLIEYKGWDSIRNIAVLPEPRVSTDTPALSKEDEELLDAVFGKIDSPVTKPPLPDIGNDDPGF